MRGRHVGERGIEAQARHVVHDARAGAAARPRPRGPCACRSRPARRWPWRAPRSAAPRGRARRRRAPRRRPGASIRRPRRGRARPRGAAPRPRRRRPRRRRARGPNESSAVGERVGGDVQDAEDGDLAAREERVSHDLPHSPGTVSRRSAPDPAACRPGSPSRDRASRGVAAVRHARAAPPARASGAAVDSRAAASGPPCRASRARAAPRRCGRARCGCSSSICRASA